MAGPSSLLSSDLSGGLTAAVRTARNVDLSDSLDAIRTDVGERVEASVVWGAAAVARDLNRRGFLSRQKRKGWA